MAKTQKPKRPEAASPKGFRDVDPAEIRGINAMLEKIRGVYERYGFDPVETPFIEYTEALGKFLPDEDRPNQGVFSFQDDDEKWLSLRYDLTAPLARYVAENYQDLPKPYRSYRAGYVFRNEKPGPGRFRQFMQMDADTVGASSVAADAEICMMAADTMEAIGIPRGSYVIRVNNRKVLDGVMEAIGVTDEGQKLTVLRAIDKLDKFGVEGVRQLLGEGRKDESGDFTKGAQLPTESTNRITSVLESLNLEQVTRDVLEYVIGDHVGDQGIPEDLINDVKSILPIILREGINTNIPEVQKLVDKTQLSDDQIGDIFRAIGVRESAQHAILFDSETESFDLTPEGQIERLEKLVGDSAIGKEGVQELAQIIQFAKIAGYENRIVISEPTVRGLEYYTGPVFEAELTFETTGEDGKPVRFGSVGGGGRYDGLVSRFINQPVPATGFSVGVSRLYAALKALGKTEDAGEAGPVVVTVMDRDRMADYQGMAAELRAVGIRAEVFLGNPKNVGKQFQYADQRGSPCVVIEGSDERERGVLQIKDLRAGAEAAANIESHEQWKEERPGQFEIARADLVAEVKKLLDHYGIRHD